MAQKRILLVEDDKNISKLVKYNLEKAEYDCTSVISGEKALEVLEEESIDLIVLDIMLPKMDGLETCRVIKGDKRFCKIPVIMLTAKSEEIDRIVGFELGAEDYVTKPFSPRELILRIKTILKRGGPVEEDSKNIIVSGKVKIDIPRHMVFINKKEVRLTLLEFKLLELLLKRKGRVQSREALLYSVWDVESEDITTRTIDTHIKRLRQKLGKEGKLIETVRGIGYRFVEKK